MHLQNGLKPRRDLGARRDFVQAVLRQFANYFFDERLVRSAFDYLHQLQRRLFQFDALRRRFVKRAIDDMRPMNQIAQRFRIKPKFRLRDKRDEFGAGLAGCIEKFLARFVRPKVSFVLRREKG